MKRILFAAALLAASVFGVERASAGPFVVGTNDVFFQNVESLHDGTTGDIKPLGSSVNVGDVFIGIFNVQNISSGGAASHFLQSATHQLSGIFAHRVVHVGDPDPFDPAQTSQPHITLAPVMDTQHTFTGIDGSVVDLRGGDGTFGTADDLLNPTTGEMFRLFEQSGPGTTQYKSNGTFAEDVSVATDGSLVFSYGYDAGGDGVFGTDDASAADDTGYMYSHAPGITPVVNFTGEGYVGLDIIENETQIQFGKLNDPNENEIGDLIPTKLNDVVGTFELELNLLSVEVGGNSPWQFGSNDPISINVIRFVPEPSSMALLGVALACVGTGAVVRRRKKDQADV